MKAYVLTGIGSADKLALEELPMPKLAAGEVLIKTAVIDVNPVDNKTLQGKGQYQNIKDDAPVIIGWGLSGVVLDKASDVEKFDIGDEVFGLIHFPGHGRTYAQFVAAPAAELALKPQEVNHRVAAASTLAALMAYQALQKGQVKKGERVLIQGAAGGVGFPAVQLAKAAGAYVIGTATAKDFPLLKKEGVDELIDYTTTDFSQVLTGIDFVLDTVGGESTTKVLHILRKGGRLITIPSGGSESWRQEAARLGVEADFLFVHSSGSDMEAIAALLAAGKLRPNIAHWFRFSEVVEMHRQMLTKSITGKSVVQVE